MIEAWALEGLALAAVMCGMGIGALIAMLIMRWQLLRQFPELRGRI